MSVAVTNPGETPLVSGASNLARATTEVIGQGSRARTRRPAPASSQRYATDDEILGISTAASPGHPNAVPLEGDPRFGDGTAGKDDAIEQSGKSANGVAAAQLKPADAETEMQFQSAFNAHPELRRAWQDAQSYREVFATPEAARAATTLLADLDRIDTLFFSRRPEDHKELAHTVASLDPAAFASLAQAMSDLTASNAPAPHSIPRLSAPHNAEILPQEAMSEGRQGDGSAFATGGDRPTTSSAHAATNIGATPPTASISAARPSPAQLEFLHAANAAAVQGVIDAIETQVGRLLPEGVPKTARDRVVGEIYRELDASLGSNRQLGQQIHDAFRSGSLDAAHQRAIVSLVTGRARQSLPGIAKRVLGEWTSTVVAANQDRLARQRAAADRVDIAGTGRGVDGGRRALGPRDIDYGRMSDSDILNL